MTMADLGKIAARYQQGGSAELTGPPAEDPAVALADLRAVLADLVNYYGSIDRPLAELVTQLRALIDDGDVR